jgi:hypothetical protein
MCDKCISGSQHAHNSPLCKSSYVQTIPESSTHMVVGSNCPAQTQRCRSESTTAHELYSKELPRCCLHVPITAEYCSCYVEIGARRAWIGNKVMPMGSDMMQGVQCTVNNQIVVSTLMNMCDHPNHVSIGEVWRPERMNIRIPIFVTGNDFSTLYAPLVRDGRMDKCAHPLLMHAQSTIILPLVGLRLFGPKEKLQLHVPFMERFNTSVSTCVQNLYT